MTHNPVQSSEERRPGNTMPASRRCSLRHVVVLVAALGETLTTAGCGATTKPPTPADRGRVTAINDALVRHDHAAFERECRAGSCFELTDNRYDNSTPLIMAAITGDRRAVRLLLDAGADPDVTNDHGRDALMSAAEAGHLEIVQELLRRGADVRAKDERGATALLLASLRNRAPVVAELIRAGADVSARDKFGQTPLHVATVRGRMQVARMLLANGADVNAEDEEGWTALRLARRYGYAGLEELYLCEGADDPESESN